MNVRELINKRVLLKINLGYQASQVEEYKILEVSPSGTWIKVMNLNGRKFWKASADIAFVEELIDLKAEKPLL